MEDNLKFNQMEDLENIDILEKRRRPQKNNAT